MYTSVTSILFGTTCKRNAVRRVSYHSSGVQRERVERGDGSGHQDKDIQRVKLQKFKCCN